MTVRMQIEELPVAKGNIFLTRSIGSPDFGRTKSPSYHYRNNKNRLKTSVHVGDKYNRFPSS